MAHQMHKRKSGGTAKATAAAVLEKCVEHQHETGFEWSAYQLWGRIFDRPSCLFDMEVDVCVGCSRSVEMTHRHKFTMIMCAQNIFKSNSVQRLLKGVNYSQCSPSSYLPLWENVFQSPLHNCLFIESPKTPLINLSEMAIHGYIVLIGSMAPAVWWPQFKVCVCVCVTLNRNRWQWLNNQSGSMFV